MQPKTILFCLLLMLPTLFMGQVLPEINKDAGSLPDPDKYPLGIYLKLGIPIASSTYQTGHKNIRQVFQEGGIDIPRLRSMNVMEVGVRYKRLYLEIGGAGQWINSPIPFSPNDATTVNSSQMSGWVNAGFSVWQNRNSALLLRLGIGADGFSYQIRSLQNVAQVDFRDLLTATGSTSSTLIYHEDTFLDLGLEVWRGRAKSRGNFGQAIRLGYRHGLQQTAWEALDSTSLNAPLDRMGEIYLHVCFHLGYNFLTKSK